MFTGDSDMNKKLASAFVSGCIIGVLGAWVFFSEKEITTKDDVDSKRETPSVSKEENIPLVFTPDGTFLVPNQSSGNTVRIDRVEFPEEGGWLVIREDRNGEIGNALGARRFGDGVQNGTVELLRNTQAGKKYYAIMHRDNGDWKFELSNDQPYQDILLKRQTKVEFMAF